jgi:hypothetical protein
MADNRTNAAQNPNTELQKLMNAPHFDVARFSVLIAAGADPNSKNADGMPLLHQLAQKGHAEAIGMALKAGADVHATDKEGNTAIFEAYHEQVLLTLLKAGASPNHRNHKGVTAATHLPLEHSSFAYRSMVVRSANMLRDCAEIETAANNGRLSAKTWAQLFPSASFHTYVPSPEKATLAYFLHCMEENGQLVDKGFLDSGTQAAMAARHAVKESEAAALAWRAHRDKANDPVTVEEWKDIGIFDYMDKHHRFACLFTADYWSDKESLDEFVELAEAIPKKAFDYPSNRLQQEVGNTMRQWLQSGGGKALDSHGIRALRDTLPPELRSCIGNLHALISQRRSESQTGIGR